MNQKPRYLYSGRENYREDDRTSTLLWKQTKLSYFIELYDFIDLLCQEPQKKLQTS